MATRPASSKQQKLAPILRWFSATFFTAALLCVVALLVSDGFHQLKPYAAHQQIGALALIAIGVSYIGLQFTVPRPTRELLQGLFLGTAFVLWGGEQLLKPQRLVTLMDALVVTIFVIDLSAIIWNHLKRKDHEVP